MTHKSPIKFMGPINGIYKKKKLLSKIYIFDGLSKIDIFDEFNPIILI